MGTIERRTPSDAVFREYARTRAPELRDSIVESYLYIAEIVARKFSGRGVEYDDLYQVAALALVKGLERYDPDRSVKFQSFITPTMVGEVKNYFRDRSRAIRIPRRSASLAREIREKKDQLEKELHRSPKVSELAERMQISEEDVLEGLELSNALTLTSLDDPVAEEATLDQFLGVDDPGYEGFEQGDMLLRAMEVLDERQKAIVRARFFEGLSQRDVADRMQISQMTVSRAERRALELLRKQMEAEDQ